MGGERLATVKRHAGYTGQRASLSDRDLNRAPGEGEAAEAEVCPATPERLEAQMSKSLSEPNAWPSAEGQVERHPGIDKRGDDGGGSCLSSAELAFAGFDPFKRAEPDPSRGGKIGL